MLEQEQFDAVCSFEASLKCMTVTFTMAYWMKRRCLVVCCMHHGAAMSLPLLHNGVIGSASSMLCMLEVVEHVADTSKFVASCASLSKVPGPSRHAHPPAHGLARGPVSSHSSSTAQLPHLAKTSSHAAVSLCICITAPLCNHYDPTASLCTPLHCILLLRQDGGAVFLSTINRTEASYAVAILAAEHVLSMVPQRACLYATWFCRHTALLGTCGHS